MRVGRFPVMSQLPLRWLDAADGAVWRKVPARAALADAAVARARGADGEEEKWSKQVEER